MHDFSPALFIGISFLNLKMEYIAVNEIMVHCTWFITKYITGVTLRPLTEDTKISELLVKIQLSPIAILRLASGIQNSAQGCSQQSQFHRQ